VTLINEFCGAPRGTLDGKKNMRWTEVSQINFVFTQKNLEFFASKWYVSWRNGKVLQVSWECKSNEIYFFHQNATL